MDITSDYVPSRTVLGDTHNFGFRVSKECNKWMHKPRPLTWEHMFLDPRSRLRSTLDSLEMFGFLPELHIDLEYGFFKNGRAECLSLNNSSSMESDPLLIGKSIGSLLALCIWFGIGDLHDENLIYGSIDGKPILAPIDIECIFEKIPFPSLAYLLPTRGNRFSSTGLSFVDSIEHRESLMAPICNSYIKSLLALENVSSDIKAAVNWYAAKGKLTSRYLLRSTSTYQKILTGSHNFNLEFPLIDSEKEQLQRGDIPYFFRFVDSHELCFWKTVDRFESIDTRPLGVEATDSFRLLSSSFGGLLEENFTNWIKIGLMQIIDRFIEIDIVGSRNYHLEDVSINLHDDFFDFQYNNLHLRSPRFLGPNK